MDSERQVKMDTRLQVRKHIKNLLKVAEDYWRRCSSVRLQDCDDGAFQL